MFRLARRTVYSMFRTFGKHLILGGQAFAGAGNTHSWSNYRARIFYDKVYNSAIYKLIFAKDIARCIIWNSCSASGMNRNQRSANIVGSCISDIKHICIQNLKSRVKTLIVNAKYEDDWVCNWLLI